MKTKIPFQALKNIGVSISQDINNNELQFIFDKVLLKK